MRKYFPRLLLAPLIGGLFLTLILAGSWDFAEGHGGWYCNPNRPRIHAVQGGGNVVDPPGFVDIYRVKATIEAQSPWHSQPDGAHNQHVSLTSGGISVKWGVAQTAQWLTGPRAFAQVVGPTGVLKHYDFQPPLDSAPHNYEIQMVAGNDDIRFYKDGVNVLTWNVSYLDTWSEAVEPGRIVAAMARVETAYKADQYPEDSIHGNIENAQALWLGGWHQIRLGEAGFYTYNQSEGALGFISPNGNDLRTNDTGC